jgi:hypothetical protein
MNPINSPQPWLLHLSPIVRTLLEVSMNMTAGTTEVYNPGDPYAPKRVVKGGQLSIFEYRPKQTRHKNIVIGVWI